MKEKLTSTELAGHIDHPDTLRKVINYYPKPLKRPLKGDHEEYKLSITEPINGQIIHFNKDNNLIVFTAKAAIIYQDKLFDHNEFKKLSSVLADSDWTYGLTWYIHPLAVELNSWLETEEFKDKYSIKPFKKWDGTRYKFGDVFGKGNCYSDDFIEKSGLYVVELELPNYGRTGKIIGLVTND